MNEYNFCWHEKLKSDRYKQKEKEKEKENCQMKNGNQLK
jgi:hypothetical protein